MKSITGCIVLFVSLCTLFIADAQECMVSENPAYDFKINLRGDGTIDDSVTLYFSFVNDFTAMSAQLVHLGTGWLAIALSAGGMIGSEAIIGLPDEPISATNPGKYYLGGYSASAVTLRDDDVQTLTSSSIVQDTTSTTLTFTKLLEEPGDVFVIDPFGVNTFLWAHGTSNTLGYHSVNRSPFVIDFGACMA